MEKTLLLSAIIIFLLAIALYACAETESCKHDDPTQNVVYEAKAPTCQESGLTEGIKCNLCGEMVVPQVTIEKLECTPGEWIIDKESSKTEDGARHTDCTECGTRIDEVIYAGSKGLVYRIEEDGKNCTIKGIGTCTDTEIVIPTHIDGYVVVRIGSLAFSECKTITKITVPNTVRTIGESVFSDCDSLTNIEVVEDNKYLTSIDGSLYSKDGKTLIWYAKGNKDKIFTISNSVENIAAWAFYGCTFLENITIPDSVTTINNYAFRGCTSLTSVVIPDSVTTIGSYAFANCTSLINITIPNSVTDIGEKALAYCTNLSKIYFDGTVEQWGAIAKGELWDKDSMAYTIYCTDGEIAKDGTVTN